MPCEPCVVRVQILSDLHLEFASHFRPTAAPDADLLIAAGDLGHSPDALRVLADWPVPVIAIPGNHEYDGSDIDEADEELRSVAAECGVLLLNKDVHTIGRVRFVGCARWWDYDLLGPARRDECMRFGERYLRHMGSARHGRPLRASDVRELAIEHRSWLESMLRQPFDGATVALTHSGPSARSADPRYGVSPGTASFCNADDDLLAFAAVWVHGHLHCPHDYLVGTTRVVCNPRGYERLHEHNGYVAQFVIDI